MQNYRDAIKQHFEKNQLIRNLLAIDFIFYGLGLLFLLFNEFSIIRIGSDLLYALGFWLFWFGIFLSFVKKAERSLMIGLGLYGLLYLADFFYAIYKVFVGYGFYGVWDLISVGIAVLFLLPMVKSSDYYNNFLEQKRAAQQAQQYAAAQQQAFAAANTVRCGNCGFEFQNTLAFCPNCGQKKQEAKLCGQCGSPLRAGSAFCISCGAKVEASSPVVVNQAQAAPPVTGSTAESEHAPAYAAAPVTAENADTKNDVYITYTEPKPAPAETTVEPEPAASEKDVTVTYSEPEPEAAVTPAQPEPAPVEAHVASEPPAEDASVSPVPEVASAEPIQETDAAEITQDSDQKSCPSCGNKLSGNEVFCTNCGRKL